MRVLGSAAIPVPSNPQWRKWIVGRAVDDADLRHNSVDAVRLGLALLVVFSHAFPLSGNPHEPLAVWSHGVTSFGEVAVAGFFTLSGYLITRSFERVASLPRYLWHRALRILPGFWVCLLLTAFVIAPISARLAGMWQHTLWTAPDGPISYLRANWQVRIQQWQIAGLPLKVPYPHAFDGSLWTLWLECRCYIALAVIGALGVLHHARWLVLLIALALIAALLSSWMDPSVLRSHHLAGYYWQWMDSTQLNLELWTCFFVGASAYLYRRFLPLSPIAGLIALVAYFALTATEWGPLAAAVLLSYAMLVLGFRVGVRQAARLRGIGDLSYGTYIYAFPIQQLLALLGFTALPVLLFGAMGAILTLPVAYVSYHLIEEPFLRMKSLGLSKTRGKALRQEKPVHPIAVYSGSDISGIETAPFPVISHADLSDMETAPIPTPRRMALSDAPTTPLVRVRADRSDAPRCDK